VIIYVDHIILYFHAKDWSVWFSDLLLVTVFKHDYYLNDTNRTNWKPTRQTGMHNAVGAVTFGLFAVLTTYDLAIVAFLQNNIGTMRQWKAVADPGFSKGGGGGCRSSTRIEAPQPLRGVGCGERYPSHFWTFYLEIALFGTFCGHFKVYIPNFACPQGRLEDDLRVQMKFMLVSGLDSLIKSTLRYSSG